MFPTPVLRPIACCLVFVAAAWMASPAGADNGSIAVRISTPVNQYIVVPKVLPEGLPASGAQATVSAALTDPALQQEETITQTVVVWFVDSVKVADGTRLNGTPWAPCDLPQELYNSNTSDAENRVLKTPGSLSTDVRLGLKETGHVQVTVSAGVRWDITRPGGSRSEYASSGPLVIDFYGVQAKLLAVPRVIAAKATGHIPMCFRILGPGEQTQGGKPATGARVNCVTMRFKPMAATSGLIMSWSSATGAGGNGPRGLLPCDQTTLTPGPSDAWAAYANGETNTYTILVPPSRFRFINVGNTGSYRSEETELWLEIDLKITKPDPSQGGAFADVVGGPTLITGKATKHTVDGDTVLGVVLLDSNISVMELGESNQANPISAFIGTQRKSSRWPRRELTKYDGSAWVAPGFDTAFIRTSNPHAYAGVETGTFQRSYHLTAALNADDWSASSSGDRWKLVVANREQGVAVVVYYGKKAATDVNGEQFNPDGQATPGGVVNVRMKQQNVDGVLFKDSTVTLTIWVESGGSTGPSQTLGNISLAANIAAGLFAILAAPETGGTSLVPWAASLSGGSWTAAGLTAALAAAAQPVAEQSSSARAECFGGMTIQAADGANDNDNGFIDPLQPSDGSAHLRGPDHVANTLNVPNGPQSNTTKVVGGDVHIQRDASALSTWRLFSSGTATAFVEHGYAARAEVEWTTPFNNHPSWGLVYGLGATPGNPTDPDPTVAED